MPNFMSFSPHCTPQMAPSNKFVIKIIIFLVNLQFIFQGSQKLWVRVAISQKASEVGFQFLARIISLIVIHNDVVSNLLEIFSSLLHTCGESCATWDITRAACMPSTVGHRGRLARPLD